MTSASITLDDTHWPLLILHFVGSPSLEQCREFFVRRTAYLERDEVHVGISDATHMKLPPAEYRQLQSEWVSRHRERLARTFLGTASVIVAPDILLLKSASVYQHAALPYPTINVTTLRAGVAWAADRLAAAGLDEATRRLRRSFDLDGEAPPR
ncbi:hypothetical protein [Archangium primigenium]|uniref:hypothetical protein n=1 Tax=[Archangium] primigenium TaxID=2792470 RepID=UPI00195E9299|nr:hypothetical protein [Archangium primigenium]MBM7113373.1 hypothetical protein [Archangium primigenium]